MYDIRQVLIEKCVPTMLNIDYALYLMTKKN